MASSNFDSRFTSNSGAQFPHQEKSAGRLGSSLKVAPILTCVNIVIAVVAGFIGDDGLYHWGVCFALGIIAVILAIKARSPLWTGLGALSAVLPPIFMFGSWAIYWLVNV